MFSCRFAISKRKAKGTILDRLGSAKSEITLDFRTDSAPSKAISEQKQTHFYPLAECIGMFFLNFCRY